MKDNERHKILYNKIMKQAREIEELRLIISKIEEIIHNM